MKTIGNRIIIKPSELEDKLEKEFRKGQKQGENASRTRIDNLELALERKVKAFHKLEEKYSDTQEEIKVYQEERENVRQIIVQKLENEDIAAGLDARKEHLDRKVAKLKDRETALEAEEERNYKSGYADGLADGVRKISEITQGDRDNAMKIAMVSAASHSKTDNVREVMNNANQLTAGTSN